MQFLKTLFWVILAVAFVIFAVNNWTPISIKLWGGLRLDTKLPVLLISLFLIGFLPPFLILKTANWRLRKRIASLEADRFAASEEQVVVPPSAPVVEDAVEGDPTPVPSTSTVDPVDGRPRSDGPA